MAKRKKTIRAGNLVKTILYTAPEPRDGERARAEKSKMTSLAQKKSNDKTAKGKAELVMAANFLPSDLMVTFTYRDVDLPKNRKAAVGCLRSFIRTLRSHRQKIKHTLKYIYVTEDKHGEGRYHHHVMLNTCNTGDIETIRSLWVYGDVVEVQQVGEREFDVWAQYLCKESGERPVGAQMWTGSRNLERPQVESCFVADDTALTVPPNCHILEREEKVTEFGSYSYIKYRILPEKTENRPFRQAKTKRKQGERVSAI